MEEETQTLEYQIDNDSRRFQYISQTLGGKRHFKFWNNYSPLLWIVCFMRQFYNSVSKDDYFALRNGFIAVSEITTITNMKLPHRDFMHGGYTY